MEKILQVVRSLPDEYLIQLILSTTWESEKKFSEKINKRIFPKMCKIYTCRSPKELCDRISGSSCVLGMKLHPIIIASSYNIPIIGISYNFKLDNYMNMIECAENCYINDNIKVHEIISKISRMVTADYSYPDMDRFKHLVYENMRQIQLICGQ